MSFWMLSANKLRMLLNFSPHASSFIPLVMCHKLMPNSHKSTAHKRSGGEQASKVKVGCRGCRELRDFWGGKRQRQKEWEAESNKNQEMMCWCLVVPFEYRAAAAGVCVEQLCTSHSITIRRSIVLVVLCWSLTLLHTLPQTSLHVCVCVCECGNDLELHGSHYSAIVMCSPFYLTILGLVFPLLAYRKGKDRPHLCSECISRHHIFNLDLSTGS